MKELTVAELLSRREELEVGEKILLSGTIYTARDAAHKRMLALLREDKPLPFEMKDALIYYAGPTPPYKGRPAGACGPTTSGRMDVYAPTLYDMGLAATIGKGGVDDQCAILVKFKNGAISVQTAALQTDGRLLFALFTISSAVLISAVLST